MHDFHTNFTLSREYLAECFDESLVHGKSPRGSYLFAASTLVVGVLLLLYTQQPKIIGVMLIALSVLELVHIRFRRAWWLTRQMWSRSANATIELSIDNNMIQTKSPFTTTILLWSDVERVIETELGLILVAKSGAQQYLSKSLFTEELVQQIITKKQVSTH